MPGRGGARAIFFVDDNITLDVARFEALCHAIVEAGFNDVDYLVQGMTAPFAAHGAELAPLMKKAGFRYVFLGIENILEDDLAFLKAGAKNSQRQNGRRIGNATTAAVDILHRHGMLVVGGLIVGNPDDTPKAIEANLAFAREVHRLAVHPASDPIPGTPMTRDFIERGLVVNPRVEEYDGTTAVTRSVHLSAEDIEFMRWKAERWMKVRHIPAVFRHDPRVRASERPPHAGAHVQGLDVAVGAWARRARGQCFGGIARSAPANVSTSTGPTRSRLGQRKDSHCLAARRRLNPKPPARM